jgi:PAS domain S-box-containing protein
MKKLSLKLLLALALLFAVVAAIQYWHRGILFRSWLDKDFRKAGRMVFAGIQQRQGAFWDGKKRSAEAAARLFAGLLAQPREGASASGSPPNGTRPQDQPVAESSEIARQLQPSRFLTGPTTEELGFFTPGVQELPAQAQQVAAAFPQAQSFLAALMPENVDVFFVSRDNWLAVLPAKKALELPDDLILVREPLFSLCTPAKNPLKETRFSPPRYDRALGRWLVTAGAPVYVDGGFQGVVGLDVPLETILAALAPRSLPAGAPAGQNPHEGASLFIMDEAFRVLFHRDLAARLRSKDPSMAAAQDFRPFIEDGDDRAAIDSLAAAKSFPAEILIGGRGQQRLVLTAREANTGWQYVFTLGAAEMFANSRRGEETLLLVNSLVLLAGFSLLFLFLRATIIAPLARIDDELRRSLPPSPRGLKPSRREPFFAELGRLAASVQRVSAELLQRTSEAYEAREHLEKLMQTSQSIVITTDRRMHPTFMNEFGLKKLQIEKPAVAMLHAGSFFERRFIHEAAAELKRSEHIIDRETTLALRSGEKIDVAVSLSKIRDAGGQLSGFLAVIADISKRKKAEIDLKNQILFSRQIFQSIPEMIIIVDRRQRITFANKRTRDLLPASAGGSIIGQNLNSILAKSSIASGFDELVRSVLEGGASIHRINTLSPVLEGENYVDLLVEPLRSGTIIIGGIIMLRDISEWRSLTAQLRSLQGFMQKLINASPYAVISINEHGLITTWNSAAEKILGVPFASAFGQNLFTILPLFAKFKDAIHEVMILQKTVFLNDEQIFIGEEDFKIANMTLYPVTAESSGVVIHIEDVSALKQLESSLIHAQKMESLGLLTSHIIHDFNNLLSGIMGYASLLEKKVADNPKLQKYVSTIITSSERASMLINQLLNFSRKKMAEKEILSLNDLIRETLDFLAMNLKSINLDIHLHESQLLLQADKTKMSQILINLIVNARDALENVERPIIRLRTDRVDVSNQSNLLDGRYAQIEISDNGSGISLDNQKKIFEPFFTTKGQGRGTGLGLAIVREIIHDYNGRIELTSVPGRGTTFSILLPLIEDTLSQAVAKEERAAVTPLEGLVLLIDDEEVVRDIGADMLKSLGLNCLTAANGSEGIELFKKNAGEISLVILDIEMPGLTGEKVFQALRELRPDVKILIASGYGKEYLEAEVFKGKIGAYMPKPFKIEQLSYQVNKILGGRDV